MPLLVSLARQRCTFPSPIGDARSALLLPRQAQGHGKTEIYQYGTKKARLQVFANEMKNADCDPTLR